MHTHIHFIYSITVCFANNNWLEMFKSNTIWGEIGEWTVNLFETFIY